MSNLTAFAKQVLAKKLFLEFDTVRVKKLSTGELRVQLIKDSKILWFYDNRLLGTDEINISNLTGVIPITIEEFK